MKKSQFLMLMSIVMIWTVSVNNPLKAQTRYTLASGAELKILGSSSLKDWSMTTNAATGQGQFTMDGTQFKGIQSLTVETQAESLKSGTRGLDNNAYKALKTGQHKQIRFTLREITGSGSSMQARGDFTIAGVTKSASFPVKVNQSGNKVTFSGEVPIKLTDFGIDPPTAMMGTVKTRDEARISFNTTFQPAN